MTPIMEVAQDYHVTLPVQVEDVLRDSFVEADPEGRGYIDCRSVLPVVRKALGISLSHTEREKIVGKAELLARKGECVNS